jgi:hypothetical protein
MEHVTSGLMNDRPNLDDAIAVQWVKAGCLGV